MRLGPEGGGEDNEKEEAEEEDESAEETVRARFELSPPPSAVPPA